MLGAGAADGELTSFRWGDGGTGCGGGGERDRRKTPAERACPGEAVSGGGADGGGGVGAVQFCGG